jgi:hypothetical protein
VINSNDSGVVVLRDFGGLAAVPVMAFSLGTQSHDFRFQGPSVHGRCGQRMCHFDDRLQADLADLPVCCVTCFEDCATESG